ncbi:MAG: SDR family oxidoreductase [Rhodospirillaceae bacterium]|jgi:NAD(P)-dependent dehydrogenase (short-subunit alcohol dehydrogenase family)|nr:SDR family oxidoreductase [Rhodospirillaceae bacterium]MBT3493944.1 SDR family oxidoreductase [Rhodospirillaceae bacterium]MBT3780813.1 SDR family oxidoreductase [Rhodospirillaceae bacterium]MBT3976240.1 SDR family oxidoreductase [Rhodospirillaceae bacterium]MBT4168983.1 SDR family oxidoreductase [Rhodospirillaceae bacterium]
MLLENKIVLITGAGNGIGAGVAQAMAEAGANVVCADINAEAAQQAADNAARAGVESLALAADVGDVDAIEAMLDAAMERFGRLDVIVNNAGVTRKAYIMDLTEADWDRIHRVNSKGVFFCLQGAARRMIEQGGGRIINMASIAGRGYQGTSNAAYAASKGAVIALTKTAAQQLGRHDITVNAICPGVTRTALLEQIFATQQETDGISRADAEARAARPIPLRRINEPEDIAAMAVFLASPGARNITGQAYNVDGGLITS